MAGGERCLRAKTVCGLCVDRVFHAQTYDEYGSSKREAAEESEGVKSGLSCEGDKVSKTR